MDILKEKLLEELLENYLLEQNDQKTRNKIAESVSEIVGFLCIDDTTPEMIDDGYVVVQGLNPENEKMFRVTIQPTNLENPNLNESIDSYDDGGCSTGLNKD